MTICKGFVGHGLPYHLVRACHTIPEHHTSTIIPYQTTYRCYNSILAVQDLVPRWQTLLWGIATLVDEVSKDLMEKGKEKRRIGASMERREEVKRKRRDCEGMQGRFLKRKES